MKKKKTSSDWVDESLKVLPWAMLLLILLYEWGKKGIDKRQLKSMLTSIALRQAIVRETKKFVDERRPFSLKENSFPSGHTASAFAAAELMRTSGEDLHPAIYAMWDMGWQSPSQHNASIVGSIGSQTW